MFRCVIEYASTKDGDEHKPPVFEARCTTREGGRHFVMQHEQHQRPATRNEHVGKKVVDPMKIKSISVCRLPSAPGYTRAVKAWSLWIVVCLQALQIKEEMIKLAPTGGKFAPTIARAMRIEPYLDVRSRVSRVRIDNTVSASNRGWANAVRQRHNEDSKYGHLAVKGILSGITPDD